MKEDSKFLFSSIIKQSLYSAKISSMLAQENISVEFDSNVTTASYVPQTKTIVFPYTTSMMDKDIHELFMFHEVSHAINVKEQDCKIFEETNSKSCLNIVLDIRDERLIKAKYPGSIKTFNIGYEKLLLQGFFGKKEHVPYKGFADRLNVYAKVGPVVGSFINFTKSEAEFYNRCMLANTSQELVELANELDDIEDNSFYSKGDIAEYIHRLAMSYIEDDEDEISEESYEDIISMFVQEIQETRVQAIFDKNFQESIINDAKVCNYQTIPLDHAQFTKSSHYVDFLKKDYDAVPGMAKRVREMRADVRTSVDSMVRVFESKKAALRARNAKIDDTGMLNLNKIYRYQFDDKIFKSSIKLPNSKNHAYVLLLDFSGSMKNNLKNVIEQLIVITEFLRRIQVPYKVFAFGCRSFVCTAKEVKTNFESSMYYAARPGYMTDELFEVLNSDMTMQDHNISIAGLLSTIGYSLGNTPTTHAICAMEIIANEFFNKVAANKKHIVIITDGEQNDSTKFSSDIGATKILSDALSKVNVIHKGNAPYSSINAIANVLEARHGIELTTISIVNSFSNERISPFVSSGISDKESIQFKKNGFAKLICPYTNRGVFFAKPFNVENDLGDFDIEGKTTSYQMSRKLINNLKAVNKSRSFLNALAENLS